MRIYRYNEFKKLLLEKSITGDDLFGSDNLLDNLKKLLANITSFFALLKDNLFGSNIKNKLARLAYDYGMTKRIARDVEDLDGVLKEIVDVLQDDKILNKFNEGSDNSRKYQDVVNFSELGYRYLCLKKDFVGVMNNSEDMGNLMSKIDKNAQPVSEKINYLDFIKESLLLESSPKKDKDVRGDDKKDTKDNEDEDSEEESNDDLGGSDKVETEEVFNFEASKKEDLNKELTAIILKMDKLLVDYFNKFEDIRVEIEDDEESDDSEKPDEKDTEKDTEKKKDKDVSKDDEGGGKKKDKDVSGDDEDKKDKDKDVENDSTNESILNESAPTSSNLASVKFKDTYDKNDINNNPLKLWVEEYDLDLTDEILIRNNIMVRIMESISVMTYHNVKYNFKYNFNDDVIKDFTQFKPEKRLESIKEKARAIINGVKNEEKQKKYELLWGDMIKHFDDSTKQAKGNQEPLADKLEKTSKGYKIFDTNEFLDIYSKYTKDLDALVKSNILANKQTYLVSIKTESNLMPYYFSKIGKKYLVSHYIKSGDSKLNFFVICDDDGKEIKMDDANLYKDTNYVKSLKLCIYTIDYNGYKNITQQLDKKAKLHTSTIERIELITNLKSLNVLSKKDDYVSLIPSLYFGNISFEGKLEQPKNN